MEKIVWFLNKLNFLNLVYFALVVYMMRDFLFVNWYFYSLDFSSWPNIWLYDGQYYPNQTIYYYLLKFLSYFIWSVLSFKIFIFWIFISIFYSIKYYLSQFETNKYINFLALIFFAFNPFVYPRFEQWQFFILYAYSLLPFLFYFLEKNLLYSLIISWIILSFSPHFVFIIWIVYLLYLVLNYKQIDYKKSFIWLLFVLVFNSYWIFSLLNWTNISNFSITDAKNFSSFPVYFSNIYLEILSLNGFWWDKFYKYAVVLSDFRFPFLWFLLLNLVFWLVYMFRFKSKKHLMYLFIFIFSFILSLWISYFNIFSFINLFLFEHIPFYLWLREANKFSSLLVMCYLFFIVQTLIFISKLADQFSKNVFYLIFWVFILLNNFSFYMIFSNQFKAYKIPKTYFEYTFSNSNYDDCKLKTEWKIDKCYNTLVLPRHQSIKLSFIDKTVSNPSWFFYWDKVLFGDNIESGNIFTQSIRYESVIIEKYFNQFFWKYNKLMFNKTTFLSDLKSLWISNIVLYKEADFKKYKDFFDDIWLKSFENENVIFYSF